MVVFIPPTRMKLDIDMFTWKFEKLIMQFFLHMHFKLFLSWLSFFCIYK